MCPLLRFSTGDEGGGKSLRGGDLLPRTVFGVSSRGCFGSSPTLAASNIPRDRRHLWGRSQPDQLHSSTLSCDLSCRRALQHLCTEHLPQLRPATAPLEKILGPGNDHRRPPDVPGTSSH